MKREQSTNSDSLLLDWFARRGWQPFEFQRQAWTAFLDGESGLIHAATGAGKSYAALGGPLTAWAMEHPDRSKWPAMKPPGLTLLWITPLRALARDTEKSLRLPLEELGLPWTVARRTGDTSSSQRQKQKTQLPSLLITTLESLSLQLSYPDAPEKFRHLQTVVVDEWHELLGSKRGTMTELCLARLRAWRPELRTWGLSATIGNLDTAMECLLGKSENLVRYGERKRPDPDSIVYPEKPRSLTLPVPYQKRKRPDPDSIVYLEKPRSLTLPVPYQQGKLIEGNLPKRYQIASLIPKAVERFPWAGHIGLKMLPQVVEAIAGANSTLVFTNVRSQCEIWYQALLEARPDWAGEVAIHHGSLDREVREWVESAVRAGRLRAVVCTSSLDLGVDFSPVDQVIQIGSPKGVARMLQRAGRSGHQPGSVSRLLCSPTNAFELIEFAATRRALESNSESVPGAVATGSHLQIESRLPVSKPLDLLVQHLVTIGVGTGFAPEAMREES